MSNTPYTYNFNPGPAKVPKEVLLKAQEEFVFYRESGISVMGKHIHILTLLQFSNLTKILVNVFFFMTIFLVKK